jgi:uncharacterized membrane protein
MKEGSYQIAKGIWINHSYQLFRHQYGRGIAYQLESFIVGDVFAKASDF